MPARGVEPPKLCLIPLTTVSGVAPLLLNVAHHREWGGAELLDGADGETRTRTAFATTPSR
jgi:hypothetical protein